MTNREAAEVLRISTLGWNTGARKTVVMQRGADALEMLDYLFHMDGDGHMRVRELLRRWDGETEFLEWVEKERKRNG